ncbi:MAG: DUF3536 domain-containing protein [Elusimicrobiota bacterium]
MKKTFILHAHFYQPPRENPWSGMIEHQETACPANDWNERIYNECYLPNTSAIIHTPEGHCEEVNNYKYISFDVGPTLSRWMAEHHMDTYKQILEADWQENNAVAMAFNHTILPLDSSVMRRVQIAWGIEEFKIRYRREPAGMWLPECAFSYDVAEDLINSGIKFMLLTQGQAESVKRLYGNSLYYVSGAKLDIRRPYRLETRVGYIDVFFSHNELAGEISFGGLMNNPVACADRIEKIFGTKQSEDLLVSVATDGETFGHHHKGMEQRLAYLLKYELPARGIEVSCFEKYISEHPPKWAVRVTNNSSWSCCHGIERWKSACGCGKEGDNDLEWRKPLRDSLNWLAGNVLEIFTEKSEKYFTVPPREALENYGKVLTNSSLLGDFHSEYVVEPFRGSAEVSNIMEMMHFTSYMFTSCGWFFGDLSRLEPVQNLSYALRAIELMRRLWGIDLEKGFSERFNDYPDACYIWNGIVKNRRIEPSQLAADFYGVYRATGIKRNKYGDWYLELITSSGSSDSVRAENSKTGEILEFDMNID